MKKVYTRLLCMFLVVILLLCIGGLTIVMAQPSQMVKESTLTKVLEKKVLRVGVLTQDPPFGYLDKNFNNVGYDIDIAKIMAEALGAKLELVETENVNRVPNIITGKVDIIIGLFSNTVERSKSISFSKPYAPVTQVLVGRKDNVDFKNWTDTAGLKIALGRGTSQDIFLTEKATKGTTIVRYETPTDCFLALEQGKVDAVAETDSMVIFYLEDHPDWEIKGDPFMVDPACMGVVLGDQVWLNWVNNFIEHMLHDGNFQKVWAKHFPSYLPWSSVWQTY